MTVAAERAVVPAVDGGAVLGNALEFKRDRLGLFWRTFAECGDLGVYAVGRQRFHLVNSADLVHEILIKRGHQFEKTDRFRAFARPLLGDGLLTAMNDVHRDNRRLIQPKFNKAVVRNSVDVVARVAGTVVDGWVDGETRDIRRDMVRLVLGVVGWNLFSRDVLAEASELGDALTDAIHGFDAQASAMIPLTIKWPTPANLRYRRAIKRLERTFYEFLAARRASGERQDDWLNLLLECQEQSDNPISDTQLRDEALNMFMPGHETTATALTWSSHLLATHPEVYQRLLDEVDSVLGGRRVTLDDLPNLPYTLQVFKEAMRLYPPVYMFTRQATEDVTIGSYHLPKGAAVVFSPYALHRRPDYFPDPERFDPDRFATEAEEALPRHAYLPFGAGHRVCIGNNHALLSGHVALATIAQRVRLDAVPGHQPELDPMVTLRPKTGLPMTVRRRPDVAVPGEAPQAVRECPYHQR
ncbi:cytochrome P450 [Actinokineospora inagensis]|uniref:cytochrome P450 n=1 Tax=Actinokineospora inagensis TaxID=103730 RepID=UPI0004152B6A|nr:cytochrome P450 [Actinokineospora inagensis]